MINSHEIKTKAMNEFKTNFGSIFILFIPYLLINFLFGMSYHISMNNVSSEELGMLFTMINSNLILSIVVEVVSGIFLMGIMDAIINKNYELNQTLKYFKSPNINMIVKVVLLAAVFRLLWALIPIAGVIFYIIKSLSYSLIYFLFIYKKEYSTAREYISKSIELMAGNKFDYFIFNLSFIGWILLTIFTLGLASIFVTPYMLISETYYLDEIYRKKMNI